LNFKIWFRASACGRALFGLARDDTSARREVSPVRHFFALYSVATKDGFIISFDIIVLRDFGA
jgi:hypothetical protein